ncbi:MAG TPA: WD40 repeat domain-containing protein, partial [Gemmataceae bacterium]|nr:WD40 repeat domain-containing protein [Gemmataceae bacterium]
MNDLSTPRFCGASLLGLILLVTALGTRGDAGKMPPPDADAQAKAAALIRSVFRAEYEKARTDAAARKALASILLTEAKKTKDEPVLRFTALRQAYELATQAGDVDTALGALAELAREYAVDALQMKADALVAACREAVPGTTGRPLIESVLAAAAQATDAENLAIADRLLESAGALARKSAQHDLVARVASQAKRLAVLRQEIERIGPAVAALRKNPTDPAANLTLGKYRCLVQGKWQEGLPLLARTSDPVWSALAKKELANPASAESQVALADAWWELAAKESGETRDQLRQRAYTWYREALPDLDGATRTRVRQRIEEAIDTVPYLIVGEIRQLTDAEIRAKPVTAVAFAPDGRFVYSGGWDRMVRRIEVRTGREVGRFEGHTEEVWAVAVSSDGRQVLSGGKDNTLRRWDAETGKQLRLLEGHTDQVRAVAFAPDGQYAVSGSEDRTMCLWDLKKGILIHRFTGHTRSVEGVAFSPDGKQIVSGSWDRTVRLWDMASR